MDILFKREQSSGSVGRVNFKMWCKIELDDEEQALIERYRFDDSVLIAVLQPNLLRTAVAIGLGVFVLSLALFFTAAPAAVAFFLALCAGGGASYWWINEKRETIFVKDLIHGRNFSCKSVVELAQKEAWLTNVVATLRQVMVGAKHWDGEERHTIEPLPKDEARQVLLRL